LQAGIAFGRNEGVETTTAAVEGGGCRMIVLQDDGFGEPTLRPSKHASSADSYPSGSFK
jgi:hypothetical protein